MTSPKTKKGSTRWFQCEKCNITLTQSDKDIHLSSCPPKFTNITHNFVHNETLYGIIDQKSNEEIKGITVQECSNIVFLSQSAIQLCGLSIGEYALVSNDNQSYALRVWPMVEKTLTSVLLTKRGLELTFKKNTRVRVKKLECNSSPARKIVLKPITTFNTDFSHDLHTRIHKTHLNRFLTKGNNVSIFYFGVFLIFEVIDIVILPQEITEELSELSVEEKFYEIVEDTVWTIYRTESEYKEKQSVMCIGGLDQEIAEIRDVIGAVLGKSKLVNQSIVSRGVLLCGSPGTGKTMVINSLTNEIDAYIIKITNLLSDDDIANMLKEALKRQPTLIVIEEIETLCPSRNSRIGDFEKKFISNLLNFFELINMVKAKVCVIATSNKPDSIDLAFRRCGRLDREIEIPTPNQHGRLDILRKLLGNVPHTISEDEFKETANVAHGFVGSDLMSLCSRAALHASKFKRNKLNFEDLKFALTRVRPSAMREVQIEVPNVKWLDIGGQHDLKLILKQAVEWPIKHPESFIRLGISPPRGVLMFGPPGCSKTMIAKALATESGLNFLSIKGPELFSKWVGESERAVREVFRKARQVAPSIIFFDEIDALGGERSSGSSASVQERVLAQLLTELDGVTPLGDVTILAATNRPDKIDKALLRPGRLDRIVYVPLPDHDTRREIFKLKIAKMPVVGVDLEELVRRTEGYSGAEVNAVCHEAAMKALEESLNANTLDMKHFFKALDIITPRTPVYLLNIYEGYI